MKAHATHHDDPLIAFGEEAERGRYPAIAVGGFLVPGEASSLNSPRGEEQPQNHEYTSEGPKAGSTAGPWQGPRRPQAEAAARTTPHSVKRRVIDRDLEELIRYHPDARVTEVSSSSFPHLGIELTVGLFRALDFRATLALEVPLLTREELRLPSLSADYGVTGTGEVRAFGPIRCYHPSPWLHRSGYADPLVPDVRAWAWWRGGPFHGAPIESHHQNPDRGICACKPADWILGVHSLVDFVGMCISWIGKTLHEREVGFYPGPQHYPDWRRLERDRPDEYCGCGEGQRRYRDCCREADRRLSAYQRWHSRFISEQAYFAELRRQRRSDAPAHALW